MGPVWEVIIVSPAADDHIHRTGSQGSSKPVGLKPKYFVLFSCLLPVKRKALFVIERMLERNTSKERVVKKSKV